MTSTDREHYNARRYSQEISTSLNLNLFELNLNPDTQQHWRPMAGVGEITNEQFVGNYMIDSNKSVGHFHNSFPTNLFSYLILYKIIFFYSISKSNFH